MSIASDYCLPTRFLCEHTSSKSRVFVHLVTHDRNDALKAVLTCTDPELAERAAEVLNLIARHPVCQPLAERIEQELPAAPAASFRQALERAQARRWPVSDMGPVRRPARDRSPRAPGEPELPPFERLFPVLDHDCDDACPATHIVPRTADLLFTTLVVLADEAYDDVAEFGDEPVGSGDGIEWSLFAMLPRGTWRATADWRRRFARACDDLAADLAAGQLPVPRCLAEHLAIQLAIEDAPDYLPNRDGGDDSVDLAHEGLPVTRWDYDWDGCARVLCARRRVIVLVVAEPEAAADDTWFDWFDDVEPRDPLRGFRR